MVSILFTHAFTCVWRVQTNKNVQRRHMLYIYSPRTYVRRRRRRMCAVFFYLFLNLCGIICGAQRVQILYLCVCTFIYLISAVRHKQIQTIFFFHRSIDAVCIECARVQHSSSPPPHINTKTTLLIYTKYEYV